MKGYISSWKSGDDSVTSCPGDVFPFDLDGVSDSELSSFLRRTEPFRDSGPCDGDVPVQFVTQGGFAVDIRRVQQQVLFHELNAVAAEKQPLRAANRMPLSSAALQLDEESPLAGQVSAGLQIQHPKGSKRLNSVLHFKLSKPKGARVVLTVHSGEKTKIVTFPFEKKVTGNHRIKLQMEAQRDMGGVHHISVHAFVQRKDNKAKVRINLKRIDVSTHASRRA